ncbi:MAG: SDR family NAD(P)-dependent oxidoreductase [Candidatus Neomarinimicrobiota bacterium]
MKKVFITGASSGIGKALAFAYSKLNCCIGISARRVQLLKEISNECKNLGGTVFTYELDVQNPEKCKSVAQNFIKDAQGIDYVIANAGIGGDDGLFSGSSENINNIINTNVMGVTNSLMPFIPTMKDQNKGTLVCISSVASYVPLPFHGGYTSSKIAIRMIFNSWRPTLMKHNIKTVSICPGLIDTPIVKGAARKLPMQSTTVSAMKFVDIIKKGKKNYVYPWYYRVLIFTYYMIPNSLYNLIIKKMFPRPIN